MRFVYFHQHETCRRHQNNPGGYNFFFEAKSYIWNVMHIAKPVAAYFFSPCQMQRPRKDNRIAHGSYVHCFSHR